MLALFALFLGSVCGPDPGSPNPSWAKFRATIEQKDSILAALTRDAWKSEDPDDLLQKHVFLKIIINPEGRVKVERGPYVPELTRGKPRLGLVRVHNQSGGQPPLEAKTHYFGSDKNPFRIEVLNSKALSSQLSGAEVEYKLVEIQCASPGKREITLGFQAGKQTQDLGFRGETSVLFDVK